MVPLPHRRPLINAVSKYLSTFCLIQRYLRVLGVSKPPAVYPEKRKPGKERRKITKRRLQIPQIGHFFEESTRTKKKRDEKITKLPIPGIGSGFRLLPPALHTPDRASTTPVSRPPTPSRVHLPSPVGQDPRRPRLHTPAPGLPAPRRARLAAILATAAALLPRCTIRRPPTPDSCNLPKIAIRRLLESTSYTYSYTG